MTWCAAVVVLATRCGLAQDAEAARSDDILAQTWAWLAQERPAAREGPAGQAMRGLVDKAGTPTPAELVRPAIAARLEVQLATLPADVRAPLVEYLSAHEEPAAELALLLSALDDFPAAYRVLARLIETRGEEVAELAPLAAAICAVHDDPRDRRVNENTVPLIDPVDLFGYYADNERAMRLDLRNTPARVLVHLADAAGTLDEYEWARKRYGRDRNVGNRYQEITYDTRALRQDGAQKRVTEAGGYSLQSIRQLGGVCADQAYFALSVGKACGIPACYVVGSGGEVSHAWVGFIEQSGRNSMRWNFSTGRYEAYEDTRGEVLDPQIWRSVPDAYLSLEAYAASLAIDRRRESVAMLDAAGLLSVRAVRLGGENGATPEIRARQLELLELSLRSNPGNLDAWLFARNILASPGSTLEQKEHWTGAVDQLAGQVFPDFAFEFVEPVFNAEPDLHTRFNLWDWAAERFASRPDLAARARLTQTRIMIDQDRKPEAVAAARAVFDQYEAIDGLVLAEQLLTELGRQDEALTMYEQAFRKIRQPGRMQAAFLQQTAWFQVGRRYAALLEASGNARQAATVRKRLGLDAP